MASHQTVRLERGKHAAPEHGVCVMELASMLAGEPFSDRPRSVCPLIGGFLRSYNDALDTDRRQDLYALASAAVGTRAGREVVDRRIDRCLEWASELGGRRPGLTLRLKFYPRRPEAVGAFAAGVAASDATPAGHSAALALAWELIEIGARGAAAGQPAPGDGHPASVA